MSKTPKYAYLIKDIVDSFRMRGYEPGDIASALAILLGHLAQASDKGFVKKNLEASIDRVRECASGKCKCPVKFEFRPVDPPTRN